MSDYDDALAAFLSAKSAVTVAASSATTKRKNGKKATSDQFGDRGVTAHTSATSAEKSRFEETRFYKRGQD